MKKLSIIIFIIALAGFFSCKKAEKAEVSSNPVPPVLKLTKDSVALQKSNADSMMTFQWTTANFGINLVLTYTLEVDKQGDNFKNAVAIGSVTSATSLSVQTSVLNNQLLGLEFDPDINPSVPLPLEFRVQAMYNSTMTPINSAAVSKVVTPYYVKIVYPFLFVPGNYNSWNAGDSADVIYSAKANNIFDGYIFFDASAIQYKYSKDPLWVTNWGDNGGTGSLELNGANITPSTGPGFYHLTANINTLTHTYLLTTWSIYGSSTGNADQPMTYDSIAKIWSVTQNLSAGSVYFRANNSDNLAYSDPNSTGGLSPGTAGIPLATAGNYTVTLNFNGAIFRYNLKKN
ncbi:MAG: SusE domain-containing protein [Bacteroidales bacterium]|jgi:hypothetical protein